MTDYSSYDEPPEYPTGPENDPDYGVDEEPRPEPSWDQMGAEAWGEEHWTLDGSVRPDIRRCRQCGGPAQLSTRWYEPNPACDGSYSCRANPHNDTCLLASPMQNLQTPMTWAKCPVCHLDEPTA